MRAVSSSSSSSSSSSDHSPSAFFFTGAGAGSSSFSVQSHRYQHRLQQTSMNAGAYAGVLQRDFQFKSKAHVSRATLTPVVLCVAVVPRHAC